MNNIQVFFELASHHEQIEGYIQRLKLRYGHDEIIDLLEKGQFRKRERMLLALRSRQEVSDV